ncbi:hypothetical protein MWU65_12000 [Cellulophaga sp. F20128]|uniref:hypothetical protein n=1 Tax=Cellulophaga sp. F20128 TaxID=2926413 RepID=UPI001FF52114|nr:hypothetical protein [Cellulophaga sp. F20128]MCK0157909.1 hypothetical protein [Cellulophaga sp. F20128]
MKKTIILLFLCNSIFCYTQNYKFNILTRYKSSNGYLETVVYSNKENDNYFLKLKKYKNETIAYLTDLKNLKKHRFKVIESKGKLNEIFFQFVYLDTDIYYINNPFKDNYFKFETEKSDSLSKIVKMSTINKRQKIINNSELKIKKYSHNLFPVFRFSCLHPYEDAVEKKNIGTGIVQSYTSNNKKNSIYIYLDYFKEVNLELNVLQ